MKTITKTIKLYHYDELSEYAKEKAKSDYMSGNFLTCDLEQIYLDDLQVLFPNSDLKVQFSFSYTCDDGLNIYGELNLVDLFDNISDNFSPEETDILFHLFEDITEVYDLEYNIHYNYLKLDYTDISSHLLYELDCSSIDQQCYSYYYNNNVVEICNKFSNLGYEFINKWIEENKSYGYKFFYEYPDEEFTALSNANGWYYLENGEFYCD